MKLTSVASIRSAFLVVALCSVAGCGGRVITDPSTDFARAKPLFAAIAKADTLVLYEGLPHEGNEKASYEAEKRDEPTVEFYGFLFYRDPIEVSDADADRLKLVFGKEQSFQPWSGHKKCGGFHPDYLAEWRVGDATYRVLICLGCNEVKVYGPDRFAHCDMKGVSVALGGWLGAHRKNRPAARQE